MDEINLSRSLQDTQILPLRSLNDFLLDSRFQLPNFKDLNKWSKRVVGNLLYYQTNYFVSAIVIFILIGLFRPVKMLLGMLAVTIALAVFIYSTNKTPGLMVFKRNHPYLALLGILLVGYLFVSLFDCILIFWLSFLTPIVLMFTHASLRTRNLKNKASNLLETVGLKKTPMGMFLDFLGEEVHEIH